MPQSKLALEIPPPVAQAVNRADFMRDEGTALFTQLTRDILVPVIGNIDTEQLCQKAAEYPWKFPTTNPIDDAARLAMSHAQITKFDAETVRHHASFKYRPQSPQSLALYNSLLRYTYEQHIPDILGEAYSTMLCFPVNLLHHAQTNSQMRNLPPVVNTFRDIPGIYRSSWFHDACRTAAITANGHWGNYSTDITKDLPLGVHAASVDMDFETHDGLSTFTLSPRAKRYLTGLMKSRNDAAATSNNDNFQHGYTSGCPVTRKKPLLNTSNSYDMAKLQGVADLVRKDSSVLMNFDKTGIAYGLEATADMFERCIPTMEQMAANDEQERVLCQIH